jgi:hypothetical protein
VCQANTSSSGAFTMLDWVDVIVVTSVPANLDSRSGN